jgi:hypothetical protein
LLVMVVLLLAAGSDPERSPGITATPCVSSHELDIAFLASMTHFGGVFSRA